MADLCVIASPSVAVMAEIVCEAVRKGLHTIAIEHKVEGKKVEGCDSPAVVFPYLTEGSDAEKNFLKKINESGVNLSFQNKITSSAVFGFGAKENNKMDKYPLRILKRLTLVITDNVQTLTLHPSNPNLNGYDIIAVATDNEKIFHKLCTSVDADIITFKGSEKLPFRPKMSSINAAVEKGILFEIVTCSGSVSEQYTDRRNLISNIFELIHATRGKNIFFSSGATTQYSLRSVFAFESICRLVGLNDKRTEKALYENPQEVISRSAVRAHTYLGTLYVSKDDVGVEAKKRKDDANEQQMTAKKQKC